MRHVAWILMAFACGGKDEATSADTDAPATGECSDASYNPLAGTCVETFLADCFDPSGACEGSFDIMGNGTLMWDNGATVETSLDLSNPMSPASLTELISSTGAVCAEGRSENNVGGCASQTVYRRPDGATQTWCIQMDGSYSITCDDGTTVSVSAAQAGAIQTCQYGSDAGPCSVDLPTMPTM